MRTKYRRVDTQEIEKIKELSANHTVRQIVKVTGISKQMVLLIQKNPKNGIVNPRRIITTRTFKKKEHFFDVEGYAKMMRY